MNTNRCVRWSEGVLDFFNVAPDGSIILDVVISHACLSQTGKGFEELVNSINSAEIKRKIKKVNIIDTTYLYRHGTPKFAEYSDLSVPTPWLLDNKNSIEQLDVDTNIESWAEMMDCIEFVRWYEQIRRDFIGDENGESVIQEFRELVLFEANKYADRGSGTLKQCLDFILEECAYTCAFFKGINMVYPTKLSPPIAFVIDHYKANIYHLPYNLSNHAQRHKKDPSYMEKVNQEIIEFITKRASTVNFFVIGKEGNILYKNDPLNKVVTESDARHLSYETWKNTLYVIKQNKEIIVEERDKGKDFLSIKAPLIVDNETEGVIGLAVDITDRKKAEELRLQNKLQEAELKEREKFQIIADQVAQDVKAPLQTLDTILRLNAKYLPEQERTALIDSAYNIKKTMSAFLEYSSEGKENLVYRHILIPQALAEIIASKERLYFNEKENIEFQYSFDPAFGSTFIYGDSSSFDRMMSNIINNSMEAFEERNGVIKINFTADDNNVHIVIRDNGGGMPQEIVKKLMQNESVVTTKVGRGGIGMEQVRDALRSFNGRYFIESTQDVGTTITLIIPKSATGPV